MRYIFFYLFLILCFNAFAQNGTIKDIDGNVYKTIKIGSQVWMAENLKTAHYRDGSHIAEIELDSLWESAGESKTGAWCYYQNDPKNNPTYGKLYNWYAVVDPRHLCPTGWHVPADNEWAVLIAHLGGDEVAGGKLKATTSWNDPNTGANNSSGFTAMPAGYRFYSETFYDLGVNCYFWSSTECHGYSAWFRELNYQFSNVFRLDYYKDNGMSVRCVGD